MPRRRALPGIEVSGIHMHIGSQITDLAPFRDAFRLMRDLARELRADGIDSSISISAAASACPIAASTTCRRSGRYAGVVKEALGDLGAQDRSRAGPHDRRQRRLLVTRVIYVKEGADKTFTIVDGAMNDLIRPTLYEAYHEVWPVGEALAGDAADRAGCRRPRMRNRRLPGARAGAAAAPPGI